MKTTNTALSKVSSLAGRTCATLLLIFCFFMVLGSLLNGAFLAAVGFAIAAVMTWPGRLMGLPFNVRALTTGVAAAIAFVLLPKTTTADEGPQNAAQTSQSVVAQTTEPSRATSGCRSDQIKHADYAVRDEATLLTAPQKGAKPLLMKVGEQTLPAPLELSASVREVCRVGKWSQIIVLSLTDDNLKGWVPTTALRRVPTTPAGRRIYTTSDFEWPAGAGSAKLAVVEIVNRIMDQRPDCRAIDVENLMLDGSAATGTFTVPCFVGSDLASFDFRAADAKSARNFFPEQPVAPIDHGTAHQMCADEAKRRASHPSTVDVSTSASSFWSKPEGNAQLSTTFTAANSFGLKLKFNLVCDFRGQDLRDVSISEAQ